MVGLKHYSILSIPILLSYRLQLLITSTTKGTVMGCHVMSQSARAHTLNNKHTYSRNHEIVQCTKEAP